MKVVVNKDWGGFGLSKVAKDALIKINPEYTDWDWDLYGNRLNPDLVAVVEKLGDEANAAYATLRVIEIPDDMEIRISEYEGLETVYYGHDMGEA